MTHLPDYTKLGPPDATPDDEICNCPGAPDIKLMERLSYNPISCMQCNREVRPEVLGLTGHLVDSLANWCSLHRSVYWLWLDSQEYERWAAAELSNIHSAVNVRGRELQAELNAVRTCYYWYFQEGSSVDLGWKAIEDCPSCGIVLSSRDSRGSEILVCPSCRIVAAGRK